MGVFDDKKFEELDWISQATEPMDSELNDILALLPDEINIDFKLYKQISRDGYSMDLSRERMITWVISKYAQKSITWQEREVIQSMFALELSGEPILNFEDESLTGGEIRFLKLSSTMDEKVLEGMLGRAGMEAVNNMYFTGPGLTRANDIMELLGDCQEGLRTRSERKKRQVISIRLKKLFKLNEWKIKDTELANKVGHWIKEYVCEGNLAAYANFCRLKVMTHKDQAIYSMEEVK